MPQHARAVTSSGRSELPLKALVKGMVRLLEHLPAPLAIIDARGSIVFSNAAFATWLRPMVGTRCMPLEGSELAEIFSQAPLTHREHAEIAGFISEALDSGFDHTDSAMVLNGSAAEQFFEIRFVRCMFAGEPCLALAIEDTTKAHDAEVAVADLRNRLICAQDTERQTIAEELHDSTAQHLVSINLNLMRLRTCISEKAKSEALFSEIERSIDQASKELRISTYLLHPMDLSDEGLRSTIARYVRGFADRSGVSVLFMSDAALDRLTFDAQKRVFRIVQEALSNVHRHADATRVLIRCKPRHSRLFISILDNGRGMGLPAHSATPLGVGLSSMRLRLAQLGGRLAVRTGPWGTLVRCILPLERNSQVVCAVARSSS
jgi:signal transduction histidine kinase